MKLRDITTWVTVPPAGIGGSFWVIVKVTTDDGIEGIGECYGIPFSGDVACRMVEDTFERYVAGEDPHDVETLFRRVYSAGFTQRPDVSMMGGVQRHRESRSGTFSARRTGSPSTGSSAGGSHDRIRTYTYIYPRSVSPDGRPGEDSGDVYHDGDAAAERALEYVEMGFTALKQDPAGPYSFQGGRELSLHELARGEYSVRRIREAVGDRADILFGTHGQMTTSSAIRLARRLEPYDPLWFEEPCPPDQVDAIGKVARATSIPVATGERLTTKVEFHQALRAGVSILQPDVGRSGGIWETRKIAVIAELYNAQVAPHIYCGPHRPRGGRARLLRQPRTSSSWRPSGPHFTTRSCASRYAGRRATSSLPTSRGWASSSTSRWCGDHPLYDRRSLAPRYVSDTARLEQLEDHHRARRLSPPSFGHGCMAARSMRLHCRANGVRGRAR